MLKKVHYKTTKYQISLHLLISPDLSVFVLVTFMNALFTLPQSGLWSSCVGFSTQFSRETQVHVCIMQVSVSNLITEKLLNAMG